MISIRTELDRETNLRNTEQLKDTIASGYSMAIRSVAEYAVEVDVRVAAEFRKHLLALHTKLDGAVRSEDYAQLQSSFRGELRNYQEQSAEKLSHMYMEISAAASVMQTMADNVNTSGGDVERQMKVEIARLETAAATNDLAVIKSGIREAVVGLKSGYEQLQKSNQMMVAQLRDEIRALHTQMADERKVLYTDRSSQAWNRQKVESRIEDLIRQGEVFWLLFVRIGLVPDESGYPASVMDLTLQSLVKRLGGAIEADSLIGRWAPDLFAAVVETDPSTAQDVAREVRNRVSGMYPVQEDGVHHSVCVCVCVDMVPCPRGTKAADFFLKVGQVTEALGPAR